MVGPAIIAAAQRDTREQHSSALPRAFHSFSVVASSACFRSSKFLCRDFSLRGHKKKCTVYCIVFGGVAAGLDYIFALLAGLSAVGARPGGIEGLPPPPPRPLYFYDRFDSTKAIWPSRSHFFFLFHVYASSYTCGGIRHDNARPPPPIFTIVALPLSLLLCIIGVVR